MATVQNNMMDRHLFEEYALDCGVQMAVDIARSCGIDAARINIWADGLINAMAENVSPDYGTEDGFGLGV